MKNNYLYLEHMLESIEKIEQFISTGREEFLNSIMAQDAVYRNFEIIGEAARRSEEKIHLNHPEVNWRGIIGLRNIIIHQYDGVDPIEIWNITQNELITLKSQLQEILKRNL